MRSTRPSTRRLLLPVLLVLSLAVPAAAEGASVPSSIPSDCSRNVQAELSAFINGLPDGSTVTFPVGGCYAQDGSIRVKDKSGLVIDGNGSTFKATTENTATRGARPNWLLLRGRNLRLTDAVIRGNFHLEGQRSQQRVNQLSTEGEAGATSQPNAGVGVYGGDGIYLTDLDVGHVFGDGVMANVSEYVENSAPFETPRNVHVERVKSVKTARHCFSPNQVVGFWLEDSSGSDCWYGAVDAELDAVSQKLQDLHFLRNTFSDFNMFGLVVPVGGDGDNTRDIEIRHNRFTTRPDQVCNPVIQIGVPEYQGDIHNVVANNNTMTASGAGVRYVRVRGGSMQNNKISYIEAGCNYPAVTPAVQVSDSTNVTVANNGPTAPGADDTGSQPPPTEPPPTTGCSANNFTAGPDGSGRVDVNLTPTSGASYDFYVRHANWSGPILWSTLSELPGKLYGLTPGQTYTVWAKARCANGTTSPESGHRTVTVS